MGILFTCYASLFICIAFGISICKFIPVNIVFVNDDPLISFDSLNCKHSNTGQSISMELQMYYKLITSELWLSFRATIVCETDITLWM